MRKLTAICLTIAVLLGSAGMSWSADLQKGQAAPDYAAEERAKLRAAVMMLRWAAETGSAYAQYHLGVIYAEGGEGVIQDNVYAHMWWNMAASSGHKGAAESRDLIAKRMTPSQLEKAQDLARECVRNEYKGC
jgi:TPR repeat protein